MGDVEILGESRQAWFQEFLELPNGIPSHDTFNRVFNRIKPDEYQECFINWISSASQSISGQVIAIVGKVLRRSHDQGVGAAIDMVSAWATANHLVLGQVKVAEKSNEITAIPQLLRTLEISGCIITIDAMGCQTEIAGEIINQEADYVLALKDNQGQLFEDVQLLFDDLEDNHYKAYACDYHKTVNKGHGRIEIRECWTISDSETLRHLRCFSRWEKLMTVSRIHSQRWIGDEKSSEDRYRIASITGAKHVLSVVRSHWGIENQLHWC
ncbi:MAG: ISAs1 family transposase [Anaerolineales bacterium]|nr:ISAs1 family transposase [Anaerolineales bacterium]